MLAVHPRTANSVMYSSGSKTTSCVTRDTSEATHISEASELLSPTPAPTKPPAQDALEVLAQKIIELKEKYGKSIIKEFLVCKWQIGQEISRTRSVRNETYSHLARLVSLGEDDLRCCVAFYEKYPNQDYELRAWRRHDRVRGFTGK